ncbi:glycoside hydrolase family protein [Flavobacterium sp. A45]|uniref:glycoside hydrolase family protein n=1 Tax=Flavobacterium sp. A45 TaxID=1945862 RepID=UPI000987A5FB|nr:glycoside hydrolase family protein [Flavobacterium sp. A45]OOG63187.1 hypothetical protein B0E44_17720 [Flavobacterium sp. A45]
MRNLKFIIAFFLMHCVVSAQDDLDFQKLIGQVDSSEFFSSPDYYTWCSSVVKGEDAKYYMFYSRWLHGNRIETDDPMNYIFNGFSGWCKYSEIALAVADKIDGPYKYVTTVLKSKGPNSSDWDKFTFHNPQVRKFKNTYYLYYISNSYDPTLFENDTKKTKDWAHWLKYNCTQKIGVIKANRISDFIKGKYIKPKDPLMQPDNVKTFEVATNPTVTQGHDGRYYMMFKSRKPNVGNMTFWMAVSDKPDGKFTIMSDVFTNADMACEDPCMWFDKKRKRYYAAVKYYSNSKKLVPQFGALALITSEDGVNWQGAKNPLISMRELKTKDGNIELSHLERPFVYMDEKGQPAALFAAATIKEPSKGGEHPTSEYNSFVVCFKLNENKK